MLIEQILQALTGCDDFPPAVDAVAECCVQKKRLEFDDMLWAARADYGDIVNAIADAYGMLDSRIQHRFFLSPEVHLAIYDRRPSLKARLTAIRSLVSTEQRLCNAADAPDLPPVRSFFRFSDIEWGLMGRCALIRDGAKTYVYAAPLVANYLPIDYLSPWATQVDPHSSALANVPEFPDDGAVRVLIEHISEALVSLNSVAPTFARIVRNYTHTIRFRVSASASRVSETVNRELGAVRLLNLHMPQTIDMLRDAIVHESVHHFLSSFELIDGLFLQRPGDVDTRPVSPWSARPLALKSFCHAVFVWYALFNLTLLQIERCGLSAQQLRAAYQRRNKYASGFFAFSPLSKMIESNGVLRPDALDAFSSMQQDVISKMS